MRKICAISFLILLPATVWTLNIEDEYGARPSGMGRAFVSIADDGYAALWNPAGMDLFKNRALTGMFSRLYWGIDNDVIGQGFISYIHHWDKFGSAGISVAQLFSERWRETRAIFSYGRKFGRKFSAGLNIKLLRNDVVLSNASYTAQPGDAEHGIVAPPEDPFFDIYGRGKMGFTADVGAIFRPNSKLSVGFMAANLTQPDMSLAGISNIGREPLTIRAGASYWFHNRLLPSLDIRFVNDELNGKKLIQPHLGVEYWFSDKDIAVRTGFNPEEYTVGCTYRSRKILDAQIDYAFVYPLSDVRQTGATSHKLSATLRFLPPPKPLFDLALRGPDMSVYPKNAIIGELITVKALVENLGEQSVSKYNVSLYYEIPGKGWAMATPNITLEEELNPGEKKEIEWTWTASQKGHYQFFAAVDDNGTAIPELHGDIDEIDELNNKGFVEFTVFPLPEGTVAPMKNDLEISQVTLIREEEPVVPVIFFEPMEQRTDDRFHYMLSAISNRLQKNPDIHINLQGYYNPESDGDIYEFGEKLAANRAKSVRSVLMRFSHRVKEQIHIVDSPTYDFMFHRTGKSADHTDEDRPRAEHENRRVEMQTYVKGFQDWEPSIFFEKNSSKPDINALQILKAEAQNIQRVMERNSEVILLIEGFVSHNENDPAQLSFDRAQNVKGAIGEILGEDFVKRYVLRIFIHGNSHAYSDRGKASIAISGEGLIFRPIEGEWATKGYEIQPDQNNFVKIISNVEAGADSYRIAVVEENGKVFRVLAHGSGKIPSGVPWDWRDEHGNLINPRKKYYIQLDITDRLEQRFMTRSEPIKVSVSKRQQELETLIIVQFVFDERTSESKFLESRVEHIARKFIEKALEPKRSLVAEVGGHTDIIGTNIRNRELSHFRAQKEYRNLRQHLIYLLGLSSDAELNRWLSEHKTTFTYKGYADTKPYVITKWQRGQLNEKKIGNDDVPEGRTINRRVIIEFYMEKRGLRKPATDDESPQSMQ